MIKRIVYGWIILFLILGAIGYFLYQLKTGTVEHQQPAYKLTTTELLTAYQEDEQKANEKYLGKLIEVRGAINLLNQEDGFIYLGEPTAAATISCTLDSSLKSPIRLLKAGDTVSIKGICTGYLIDVQINRAQLLP